ncbi:MAG: radical SAM protein [Pseudomonadales bacterium]|jgi:cyclic pyranopterin phosphate synthase|nr:radical SAM protein [Pseudomonadales bacterium]MCP5333145.1 radical SAM protein [Pseudomonadales bacterium]HMU89792.1 GTP 3',8-cyclase MoaA [Pseudomonadales bacterium]HMW14372.1 GTP 3',8-cyclase MoaA [Pseudomonadales bacterium]HMW82843.1 GTP 3',8-cyclase MoaA [Pseudomonadales bacterium]
MIVDRQGRRFRKLRLSLTAACNYTCIYCVPHGKRLIKRADELESAQFIRAVRLLQLATGIEAVRITGGEPLVSPQLEPVLQGIARLGLTDLSLTTNGQLLTDRLPVLLAAGIRRINVSLDTLDPLAFRTISRAGDLPAVLAGIEAARAAGMAVRVNMVPMRRRNHDQIVPLLDYCLERGIELRYIELMRMGHLLNSPDFAADFVSMDSLLDLIGKRHPFQRTDAPHDSTAVRFEVPGRGTFGIIPNESEPFCRACTRLRLSSDGWIYGCLSNSRRHRINPILEQPDHVALPALQRLLTDALADKQDQAFQGGVTIMKLVGG